MLSNENDTTKKTWALKMYILCTYLKKVRGVLVVKNCPPACIILFFVCFSVLRYTITIRTLISQYTTYTALIVFFYVVVEEEEEKKISLT